MENDDEDYNISIYTISCFQNEIWKNKELDITSPHKSITSIETVYEGNYDKNKNYLIKLHQININNNYNDIEKINLYLSNKNDNSSYDLGEITIKLEEERFLFNNLKIELSDLEKNKFIKEEGNKNNNKHYLELNFSVKLKVYSNYIEKNNMKNKYSAFLVNNFLYSAKNQLILYSDIILLFTLSFGNKSIITFFEHCYNFKFKIFTTKNTNFANLLGRYLNNKESFFEENIMFFSKDNNLKKIKNSIEYKKYRKDIDNFMSLYILFNENEKLLNKKKLLELDPILNNMLDNEDNIIDYLKFISSNFRAFYLINKIKGGEIKIEKSRIGTKNINVNNLLNEYSSLIINQEKKPCYYFFNTSEIIEYITDYLKNEIDLEQLMSLKEIYLKEAKFFPNPKLISKINIIIHNKIIGLSEKGKINNDDLKDLIKGDEIYTNNNYKDLKNFSILEGFNISSMDDDFIERYKADKIYELFENNLNEYLTIFSKKIRHVKFFGLFFKLLPPPKHNLDTINVILNWLEKKIKSYNKVECPNFMEEINIFLNILIVKGNFQSFTNFIDIIKNNLNDCYLEKFVEILNNENNILKNKYIEYIICNIINNNNFKENENNKNNYNFENLKYFINNIKSSKIINEIFLNKLGIYHLLQKDFNYISDKYKLFTILLEDKNFSLNNNEINQKTIYWKKTKQKCSKIYNNLKNLDINISDGLFKGEENIKERLVSILKCIDENDPEIQAQIVTLNLKLNLEKWNNKKNELNNIILYEETFFKNEDREIKQEILNIIKEIDVTNIRLLNSKDYCEKLSKYNNEIERAKEI